MTAAQDREQPFVVAGGVEEVPSSAAHAPDASAAQAERRVFEKWYATASIGSKLAYWTRRAKELRHE